MLLKNNVKKILGINKKNWKRAYFYEIVVVFFILFINACLWMEK
jgi:hypothetical protein